MIRCLAVAVLLLIPSVALTQTVNLVTAEEAKLPAVAVKPGTRAITRGPAVKLASPESVSGSFPFKVEFAPRGGSKIDASSVKIEYLRGSGIDLTDRLKAAIKPEGISVAAAQAPAGEHAFRVSVRDSEGREGKAEFSLTVK